MPDVVSDEELNALAAEFVLGTLDYDERKGATALLEVDHAFRGIVRIWERRLGELHLMVEAVEPDSEVWARIRSKIPGLEQVELAIPSHVEGVSEEAVAAADSVARSASGESDAAASPAADAEASAPPAEASAVEVESTPPVSEVAASDPSAPEAAEDPLSGRTRSLDETELRLNELAALLPAAGQDGASQTDSTTDTPAVLGSQSEPPPSSDAPEPARVPEPVDEFVPPPPMPARGSAPRVEMPVRRGGRGWMAATLVMGLVAVALAALIGAWRYFPERLPEPLQVYSVLNLPAPPPPVEPPPPPPPPPAFDE